MNIPAISAPRLFVEGPLGEGLVLPLAREQANYLLNVLRLKEGDPVLLFNGRDGEWQAAINPAGRKSAVLAVMSLTRAQTLAPDIHYLFAPLKHARLDYMAQKAVEMGAGRLVPVITRRTQVSRLNLERLRANAIEAAEQCGILTIPEITPETRLDAALAALEPERLLVFCDENAPVADPFAALDACSKGPVAVLIGPEGGFDATERATLLRHANMLRLSLGPRILRADTAAVAALALVQARLGDWVAAQG
jgi:16S rRNA (uracil1498-N3)-methyltransferase